MSHCLTIRLNDEAFYRLQQQAMAAGISPEEFAAASLEQHCEPMGVRPVRDLHADRERFERHFGEVDLGYPSGADNEGIDADLVREYGDTHEAE